MEKLKIKILTSNLKMDMNFRIDLSDYNIDCIILIILFDYNDLLVKTTKYDDERVIFSFDVVKKILYIYGISLDWFVENIKYIIIYFYSKADQRDLRIENLLK